MIPEWYWLCSVETSGFLLSWQEPDKWLGIHCIVSAVRNWRGRVLGPSPTSDLESQSWSGSTILIHTEIHLLRVMTWVSWGRQWRPSPLVWFCSWSAASPSICTCWARTSWDVLFWARRSPSLFPLGRPCRPSRWRRGGAMRISKQDSKVILLYSNLIQSKHTCE